MKRIAVFIIVLLMAVPIAFAGRKREMAGTMKDNAFLDSKYGYEIKFHDNWKGTRIGKAEEGTRLVMLQKTYATPTRYNDAKDYTQIPRLVIFADSTSMSPGAFIDSILSQTYKSDAKKEIVKEFELLSLPDLKTRSRRTLTIADQTAVIWNAEAKYVKEISPTGSNSAMRVAGGYSGSMVAIKNGNVLVFFHLSCEREFFDAIMAEAMTMINGITWVKPTN